MPFCQQDMAKYVTRSLPNIEIANHIKGFSAFFGVLYHDESEEAAWIQKANSPLQVRNRSSSKPRT